MSTKENIPCAFDALFDGRKTFLEEHEEHEHEDDPEANEKEKHEKKEEGINEEGTVEKIAKRRIRVRRFSSFSGGKKKIVEMTSDSRLMDINCDMHRIVILGSAEVGKTLLINQLGSSSSSSDDRECEPRQDCVCEVDFDGWRSLVQFSDPSYLLWVGLVYGDSHAVQQLKESNASVMVIVFAVDDMYSFSQSARLLFSLKTQGTLEASSVLLVGNKTDLVRSRKVSSSQGKELANRYGLIYLDISSSLGYNVDQLLVQICKEIQATGQELQPRKKPSFKDTVLGIVAKKNSK